MSNAPDDNVGLTGPSIRRFPIDEPDLEELERIVPDLCQRLFGQLGKNDPGATKLRKQLEKCKIILSNVRWGYSPPLDVGTIPAE